jgi:biopolymer transport protein ExbD
MQVIRRNDHAARVEMLPLIDVVFLLLTFFIFSMMVMVRLDVLTVNLEPLTTGTAVEPTKVESLTVTIDGDGKLFLANAAVTVDGLLRKLTPPDGSDESPMLYIAMSKESRMDRAPVVLDLMKRFVNAGFSRYTFVGPRSDRR